jgi:aminopeptidase N
LPGASFPDLAGVLALGLAVASPAPAAAQPAQPPLAPRTARSGLALTAAQQATDLSHLFLSITLDPASRSLSGEARYRITARSALTEVQFDLDPRFAISRVSLDGRPVPASAWSNDGGLLTIDLPAPLAAGRGAEVTIAYAGMPFVAPKAPWEGGIVWSRTADGQPWIATAVEGEGCDLFWPCIDNPAKRVAVLDLAVKVPEPLVEAGNGTLVGVEHDHGWATWRWRARYPQSYGVTLQVAPYAVMEKAYPSRFGNTIRLRFWYLPGHEAGARRLLGELASYLDFFERAIGPYPWGDEKAGIAETPHEGMEHQTVNAYGNGFKLSPEGFDWLMNHEFAHEWFANQETGRTAGEMWLHEGFGMYMQPLYLRWKDGDFLYGETLWNYRKKIHARVPLVPAPGAPDPGYMDEQSGWGEDIYYKGAWVLHTLREQIGDAAFDKTLRLLVYGRDDPQPGHFKPLLRTSKDYERIVEQVTGRNWRWFFDTYLHQGPLPRLETRRVGKTLRLSWQTGAKEPFALPVEVEVGGKLLKVAMSGGKGSVRLPAADAHVVIDPHARVLRYDAAIAAWQEQEEADRGKAAAGKAKT